jgi:gamma-glutamylcyclotransferase (GGCT)/AIG2-like uncharacterized protein YtfP
MSAPCDKVFVYGTLRRGGSNHFRMEGAEFMTAATVRARLYRIDWYPGLVLDDAGDDVIGEIYQVSERLMKQLDAFEGPEYHRVMVEVKCAGDHRSPVAAWIWEWMEPVDETRRITGGDWLSSQK